MNFETDDFVSAYKALYDDLAAFVLRWSLEKNIEQNAFYSHFKPASIECLRHYREKKSKNAAKPLIEHVDLYMLRGDMAGTPALEKKKIKMKKNFLHITSFMDHMKTIRNYIIMHWIDSALLLKYDADCATVDPTPARASKIRLLHYFLRQVVEGDGILALVIETYKKHLSEFAGYDDDKINKMLPVIEECKGSATTMLSQFDEMTQHERGEAGEGKEDAAGEEGDAAGEGKGVTPSSSKGREVASPAYPGSPKGKEVASPASASPATPASFKGKEVAPPATDSKKTDIFASVVLVKAARKLDTDELRKRASGWEWMNVLSDDRSSERFPISLTDKYMNKTGDEREKV